MIYYCPSQGGIIVNILKLLIFADASEDGMKKRPFTRLFSTGSTTYIIVLFVIALMPLIIESNLILFAISALAWIAVTGYTFFYETKKEKELLDYIMTLSFDFNKGGKESLLRLPIPLSVMDKDGNILWYNELFRDKFKIEGAYDFKITDIVKSQNNADVFLNAGNDGVKVTVNESSFTVITNKMKSENNSIVSVLYWIDETRFAKMRTAYENTRPVVCELTVDNYDEVMQNTPENLRTILVGTIEKKISDWISATGGIFKKTEKDKYFIIFEKQHLQPNIDTKFAVLENVHNIKIGNTIPPTISLGIGVGGNSFTEDARFAKDALEMAFSRGGDQAVIRNESKFMYFGGTGKDVERYTRVRTRVMAGAISQLINRAENVIIMGHKNADLDSFGAAAGILAAASNLEKEAYITVETNNDFTNKLIRDLSQRSPFKNRIIDRDKAIGLMDERTLLVIVDVYRPGITEVPLLLEKAMNIVVIDHHRKTSEFIENASIVYHEPAASSTCEMVTELLQYMDENEITPDVAAALYSGMKLDTKNFTFKTGTRTFEAAAYLKRRGFDEQKIKTVFQSDKAVYAIISDMVCSSEVVHNKVAVAYTKSEHSDIQSVSAAAADELLSINGITASFTMCCVGDTTYISGRSAGDINVQTILEKIGGGGHGVVAGAQLKCSIETAVKQVKEAIDGYFDTDAAARQEGDI